MMCEKTRRADHLAPGSNQGADDSDWLAPRSGSDETNSSVSRHGLVPDEQRLDRLALEHAEAI
jgi:hypothetical protein